jgi:hypothetical protein
MELLHEAVPGTRSIAVLVNPISPTLTKTTIEDAQAAARSLGLELHILNASSDLTWMKSSRSWSNCKRADLWLALMHSSVAGLNNSQRFPFAMWCPRSTSFASSPRLAV